MSVHARAQAQAQAQARRQAIEESQPTEQESLRQRLAQISVQYLEGTLDKELSNYLTDVVQNRSLTPQARYLAYRWREMLLADQGDAVYEEALIIAEE